MLSQLKAAQLQIYNRLFYETLYLHRREFSLKVMVDQKLFSYYFRSNFREKVYVFQRGKRPRENEARKNVEKKSNPSRLSVKD